MGKEREFDALASEAVGASEKEFFAEAMDQNDPVQDETGDRSMEEKGTGLEGQHEADDEHGEGEGEKAEAEEPSEHKAGDAEGKQGDKGDGEAGERDAQGRFKPKGEEQPGKSETPAERGLRTELTSERDKRRTAETEFATYRSQTEKEMAAIRGQIELLTRQQPKPEPKQEPKEDEAPDRWSDPEGYDRWRQEQIIKSVRAETQTQEQRRVAWSFEDAQAKHGEAFTKAYADFNALPDNPVSRQQLSTIMQSSNPGERLLAWHRAQEAQREIGNDPTAYRERLKAEQRDSLMKDPEFRKQVLEALKAEASGGGAPSNDGGPQNRTKLPPSLSSARGGAPRHADIGSGSDAELFDQVMS